MTDTYWTKRILTFYFYSKFNVKGQVIAGLVLKIKEDGKKKILF